MLEGHLAGDNQEPRQFTNFTLKQNQKIDFTPPKKKDRNHHETDRPLHFVSKPLNHQPSTTKTTKKFHSTVATSGAGSLHDEFTRSGDRKRGCAFSIFLFFCREFLIDSVLFFCFSIARDTTIISKNNTHCGPRGREREGERDRERKRHFL